MIIENKITLMEYNMMRLQQVTSATQPNVPQTQTPVIVQTKPSFKGKEEIDYYDNFDTDGSKPAIAKEDEPTLEETVADYKNKFQELADNPNHPSFVKNAGKAAVVIATGVLGYLTALYGMKKGKQLISEALKSKPVKDAAAEASKFVKETLVPDAKDLTQTVKDLKLSEKISKNYHSVTKFISKKANAVADFVKDKATSLSDNVSTFSKKEKVAKVIKFITAPYRFVKKVATGFIDFVKTKLPAKAEKAEAEVKEPKIAKVKKVKAEKVKTVATAQEKAEAKLHAKYKKLRAIVTLKQKGPAVDRVATQALAISAGFGAAVEGGAEMAKATEKKAEAV